jgi:diadenylate cyclase
MAKSRRSNNQAMLKAAGELAQGVKAGMILLVADSGVSRSFAQSLNEICKVLVVTRNARFLHGIEAVGIQRLQFDFGIGDASHFERMRQGIILGLEGGYIPQGTRLVCLANMMERGGVDSVVVVDTSEGFEGFDPESIAALAGDLPMEVVKAVLDLAVEVGEEGREGEPIGTLFVIGDVDRVLANSRVMTYDPFRGYSEREKNVCNPDNREGVKEVALMDGAFVIQEDGVILSGCRYITSDVQGLTLPKGLGARHVAAAAITNHSKAIAVAVSESSGTVRAFKRGQIVLRRDPHRRRAH